MNGEEKEKQFQELGQVMQRRAHEHDVIARNLKDFASQLFAAIETVLAETQQRGIPGLGKSRRIVHPAGEGREGLQIFIEDWSIIFVPLMGYARPNRDDEARIPPYQFKELCGRIGAFLTDDPTADAFYDFIIFNDESWFAWGYGWPKQQSDIQSTDFEALALDLIHSFVKDIFMTWNSREETLLSTALDTKKRAYTFGLPGEERQGV
ncbi:MAG: hypothetical protein GYB65_06345 [Chloroflexi bacterium]|nr:hypothetical protein [Chloroflexota bacterium]